MRQLPKEAAPGETASPAQALCALGGALRERLTENRMLAHERFTLRRVMTGLPTAPLAQNQALSRIRDASRVASNPRSDRAAIYAD